MEQQLHNARTSTAWGGIFSTVLCLVGLCACPFLPQVGEDASHPDGAAVDASHPDGSTGDTYSFDSASFVGFDRWLPDVNGNDDGGGVIVPEDAGCGLDTTGNSACIPPVIASFAASQTPVAFDGTTNLMWTLEGATRVRIVVVEDGRTLCDTQSGCAIGGTMSRGTFVLTPPFEVNHLRLYAHNQVGTATAEVEVWVTRPVFPQLRYNEISKWLLQHRPIVAPYTFVVLADMQLQQGSCPHSETSIREGIREQIAMLDPEPAFVVVIGDFLVNGQPCEYSSYIDSTLVPFIEERGIPWFTIPGNHDIYDPEGYIYYDTTIGPKDDYFDVDGLRVISFNIYNSSATPQTIFSEAQADWLEMLIDDADNSGLNDVFVMHHYPPRRPSKPSTDCTTKYLYDHHFFDGKRAYLGADRLMELLEEHSPPVTMAAFGHVHSFANYKRNGLRYMVTGGAAVLCNGAYFDQSWDPDATLPYHDGLFNHFVTITMHSTGGQDYTGQVIKLGDGTTPSAHYSFDHSTDEDYRSDLTLPFEETFTAPQEELHSWEFSTDYFDDLTPVAHSYWYREDGRLRQAGGLYHSADSCPPRCHGANMQTWTRGWSNYRYRVEVDAEDNDAVGMTFYYQDRYHYYRFSVDRERGYALLTRHSDMITELVLLENLEIAPVFELAVDVFTHIDRTEMVLYLDGQNVLSYVDSTQERLDLGGVGLYTWGNDAVWFDNIRVTQISAQDIGAY